MYFSDDFGESWFLKNILTCPNIPIEGVTGGKQDGELYLLVEYLQMMGQRRHVYIYHSLDYGESFNVYHPVALGPDPIYANFIAEDTLVEPGDTVKFSDLSNDAETWEWDFDNDGIIDSYEKNPIHIYQDTGYYTVKLTITGEVIEDYGIRHDYIHVDNITGIDAPSVKNSKFITFPVPAKNVLNIQLSFETTEIQLLDLSGRLVKAYNSSTSHNTSIELSVIDIPSGVYLLKVKSPENTITKKILINK
nr:T9SS type A sorting domain-containing protein [Bacteroidota bacterium]